MANKKNEGFTLAELVIVIVILGILAATALPKFINLGSEARAANLIALNGALKEGATMVYAKTVIEGLDSGNQTLTVNGGNIILRGGYPRVASSCVNFTSGLKYWMTVELDDSICSGGSDSEWYGVVDQNKFHFMPSGYTSTDENCYVTYTTASEFINGVWEDADSATVSATTDGC
ncbi:hypothetical protein CXF93_04830 [Moritella sp. Urea-trap-13]|nr:hypothetical protein CXF93_04830 [Moritella sp. Urea-trap-13]